MRLLTFIFAYAALQVSAQSVPSPAPKQSKPIIIKGGTAHIGNGQVVTNAYIFIAHGKIQTISKEIISATDAVIIDAYGKDIYPGLIAANTSIGLNEIESVRATRDAAEVGDFNTNIRSIISYNTDSRVTPTIRSNGVLLAQTIPFGGRISGSSSVVQLDAWNWEDAAYKSDDGIWLNWPQIYSYNGWWAEPGGFVLNKDYDKQIEDINSFFEQAKAYNKAPSEKTNLKLDGMKNVFAKKQTLYVRASEAKSILQVLDFKKKFDLNVVLVDANDVWLVAKEVAAANVSVILERLHSLPARGDEDYDLPYKKAKILKDAGVQFCLSVEGYWQVRNLPFVAGTAAAYGLTKEEALSSITLSAAKILGIDDRTGSLEVGKDANIIISTGDVLDMKSSIIEYAFIQGRQINLTNKQKELADKFLKKYEKQ
jgi:imidazolonepropionase-like amidohydrolase